jgi:hypothetical protein
MKKTVLLLLLILALTALADAEVTYLVGSVSYYRGGSSYTASLNTELNNGDVVMTGARSRVEVTFGDGSLVRLGSNAQLTIERSSSGGLGDATVVSCSGGRVWSNVTPFTSSDSGYAVKTPTATAAVRGTVFRADIYPDESTLLRVYTGSVELWNPLAALEGPHFWETESAEGSGGDGRHEVVGPHEVSGPVEVSEEEWEQLLLEKMTQIYIGGDGAVGESGGFTLQEEADDQWVAWNIERDAELGLERVEGTEGLDDSIDDSDDASSEGSADDTGTDEAPDEGEADKALNNGAGM